MPDVTTGAQSPTDRTHCSQIEIVATAADALRFSAAVDDAPAHADAVLDALEDELPTERYAAGQTVATLEDWKLHTLEVNPP